MAVWTREFLGRHATAVAAVALLVTTAVGTAAPARAAISEKILDSVVSVLPLWPGYPRGRGPAGRYGEAPEGTGVAIAAGGYIVTNLHVVARATAVTVRRHDGRLIDATIVATDTATDLAVIKIPEDLPLLPTGGDPALGDRVCAVGNPFGLGLSVSCGVVSAQHRSGVGFNAIEDFIQTDAVINPGASGGALVDGQGRLVGILSAIFTKQTDANIGVNFATSIALVRRVADDLIAHGAVRRAHAGISVADLDWESLKSGAGARIVSVVSDGGAARAGLRAGDVVIAVGDRTVRKGSDAVSAIFLHRPGDRITLTYRRDGASNTVTVTLD